MAYHYSFEVKHSGLNKYRIVKGQTKREAQAKADSLLLQWEEQWEKKCAAERSRNLRAAAQYQREKTKSEHDANFAEANRLTSEYEQQQIKMNSILQTSIDLKLKTWNDFLSSEKFTEEKPKPTKQLELLALPLRSDIKYNPQLSLIEKLSKKKKSNIQDNNDARFSNDLRSVENKNEQIKRDNELALRMHQANLDKWESERAEFINFQNTMNAEVREHQSAFEQGNKDAIEYYYDNMLSRIDDPYSFERQIEVEYIQDTKMLLIELYFPAIEDLPNIKKVTYTRSSGEFKETYNSASYMNALYDNIIYQTVLQTFYLVFRKDRNYGYIDSVVINGKVVTIDKSTGNWISPTVLSISATKEDINQLNLTQVDAKAWFKNSKGISAAKIANITPVAPIIDFDKTDSRFVDGYTVIQDIDDSVNLASMDWQDFENLIRELFQNEFNVNGGEVKITQASRDGGVDAVAFDPSPIRGGKIVIQAKRYTNVVGVSAVRDLYGTVMNEGAMKGILITTSNYGNDAYRFAQGKPLTLLNGANLLSMLESHGYKARIDIAQAREQLRNQ